MSLLIRLSTIGFTANDNTDLKIQKSFLVYLALFMSGGGILWGAISLFYGLVFQAIFPLSYLVISALNLLYLKSSKNFKTVRFIQVFISLVLPVIFQFTLGGFISSGVIILWSILSLIASLSFQSISSSINWLVFFIILTVASGFMDASARENIPEVLPENSIAFIITNIIMIASIIFGLVAFFVQKYEKSERALEIQNKKLIGNNELLAKSYASLKSAFGELKTSRDAIKTELDFAIHEQMLTYEKVLEDQKNILAELDKK